MGIRLSAETSRLKAEVTEALRRLEEMDTHRLDQLFSFLTTGECRQAFVSRYFGALEPARCGVCDNCAARAQGVVADAPRRKEAAGSPATERESALFERLRAWRREKARAEGLPAYVIFHDRVLYAIAQAQPTTRRALGEVPGVGPTRLDDYGEEVLAIVRETKAHVVR
jgi:superfamily II DNA helicase RecQ